MYIIGIDCELNKDGLQITIVSNKSSANIIEKMVSSRMVELITERIGDISQECMKKLGVSQLSDTTEVLVKGGKING
jgi:hypothetical protein